MACSQEEYCKNYNKQKKSWFLKRSYPEYLIDTEMKKKKFKSRERTDKSKSKAVSFVVAYHSSLNCLDKMIGDTTDLLDMHEEVKNVFFPGPMVSFRSAQKLIRYIVRAKSNPLLCKIRSKQCAKNYVTDTCTFTSTVTEESFKTIHHKCIMYPLTCKQCQKQHFGKTADGFRYR